MNDPKAHGRNSASPSRPLIFTIATTALVLLLTVPNFNVTTQAAATQVNTETASQSVASIVTAANTFLNSLDDKEHAAVMFDFNNTAQREHWSNFPTGAYNRAGLTYSSMTDAQRTNMMALLKVALSDKGYQQVINTMTADEVLGQSQSNQSMFGYGLYFVSFLGTPSETTPWILQWGMAPDAAAQARMAAIKTNIADTYFAWSGSTNADSPTAYFRVTGPTLLIEFAPQGAAGVGGPNGGTGGKGTRPAGGGFGGNGTPPGGGAGGGNFGGNNAQTTAEATALSYENAFSLNLGSYSINTDTSVLYHVHTIYRDPTNAYGAAITGQ